MITIETEVTRLWQLYQLIYSLTQQSDERCFENINISHMIKALTSMTNMVKFILVNYLDKPIQLILKLYILILKLYIFEFLLTLN